MEPPRVTLYYVPSDGQPWAGYISAKLKAYDIFCEHCDFTAGPKIESRTSKVNVFFVTPDFLEYPDWRTLQTVKPSSCVMVLTGTEHDDLEYVLTKKAGDINELYVHEMEQTERSVQDLLVLIVGKYEEVEAAETPAHLQHAVSLPSDYKYGREKDEDTEGDYHTLPPARQVNSLQEVIYKDGVLYIMLRRKAEGKVTVQLEDGSVYPPFVDYGVYTMQYEGNHSAEISVLHDGDVIGKSFLNILQEAKTDTTDPKTKANTKNVQNSFSSSIVRTVTVETQTDCDKSELNPEADQESRDSVYINMADASRAFERDSFSPKPKNKLEQIRELLEDETDPEEILCQCLGIEKGIKNLDDKMTSMAQRLSALRRLSYTSRPQRQDITSSQWPTLVHFGAEFNLQNFCDVLLSNPLLWDACAMVNKDGKMPHDIAASKGHTDLAIMLSRFKDFVRKERERDSGISGFSGYSRISLYSMTSEPVAHHRGSDSSGYVNMAEPEDYESTAGSRSPSYMDMSGASRITSGESDRQTIVGTDTEENEPGKEHHRKDIEKLLGVTEVDLLAPLTPELGKKKNSKSKLRNFFGKKIRSNSEPAVTVEDLAVLRQKGKHSSWKDSPRSSGTSSSTSSTISDSSPGKDDFTEVKTRKPKTKTTIFGKKKTKGLVKDTKRRASVRIKHVLDDRHGELPLLPSRPDVAGQPHFVFHDPSEEF